MKIRVMTDYNCPPVWYDELVGEIDPKELPISVGLVGDLWTWAATYDATLNRSDPASSGFETSENEAEFEDTGRALTRRLAQELQGVANVRWWRDLDPTSADPS